MLKKGNLKNPGSAPEANLIQKWMDSSFAHSPSSKFPKTILQRETAMKRLWHSVEPEPEPPPRPNIPFVKPAP